MTAADFERLCALLGPERSGAALALLPEGHEPTEFESFARALEDLACIWTFREYRDRGESRTRAIFQTARDTALRPGTVRYRLKRAGVEVYGG